MNPGITPPDAQPTGEPADPQDQSGGESSTPSREAAKYRTQLRATEQERDALAARLAVAHEREIHSLAAGRLIHADDLKTIGGVDYAQLLDDDGNVSAQSVAAAVDALLSARPELGMRRRGAPMPPTGDTARATTLAELIRQS